MSETSASEALRMLADLIEESKRVGSDGFNVIPVVVDNLAQMFPLIEASLRYHSTRAPDLDSADGLDIGTRLIPDAALVQLVQQLEWPDLPGGQKRSLRADWTDGHLRVRFGDADSPAPTNPGDRASLSLYTSLLDPTFDSELGAIVYDETSMDEDAKEIAWTVLLDKLPALMASSNKPALCKTLIVFVGAPSVAWGRHCRAGGNGARYLSVGGQISRRNPWEVDRNASLALGEQLGPLVLYLGAGAARSSKLPTGDELRDEALRRLLPAQRDEEFSILARAFWVDIRARDRLMAHELTMNEDEFVANLALERVLREEIKRTQGSQLSPTLAEFKSRQEARLDSPGPSMKILRDALRRRERLVLLTVNFDQMIEHGAEILRGYEPDNEPDIADGGPAIRLFVTEQDLKQFPAYFQHYRVHGGVVPLIKLHGSIDLGTVIADVDDTMPGLSTAAGAALRCLSDEHDPLAWVYVGCSMRDLDVQSVTHESSFARGTNEHWVAPTVDPHVRDYVLHNRELAWAKAERLPFQSRLITLSSDEFFETLRAYICAADSSVT